MVAVWIISFNVQRFNELFDFFGCYSSAQTFEAAWHAEPLARMEVFGMAKTSSMAPHEFGCEPQATSLAFPARSRSLPMPRVPLVGTNAPTASNVAKTSPSSTSAVISSATCMNVANSSESRQTLTPLPAVCSKWHSFAALSRRMMSVAALALGRSVASSMPPMNS